MNRIVLIETAEGARPIPHHFRGPRIRVGRGPESDLVLKDPNVSRDHLELRFRDGTWHAADLKSTHGTAVNGRPLKGEEPLRAGDVLRLGSRTLLVELPSASRADGIHSQETSDHRPPAMAACSRELVGSSAVMVALREEVRHFAKSDTTVLVLGESGTGKDLVARLLHDWSSRADRSFVVVNCPALAPSLAEAEIFGVEAGTATQVAAREGKARQADGGTLFLDEIGDLNLECQAKLLRFMQDRSIDRVGERSAVPVRVDVRVVAATNKDLDSEVEAGKFRGDLLRRIRASCIEVPALRERREDIPDLVAYFLARVQPRPAGISDAALAELGRREHPGNVGDLAGAVEAAAARAAGGIIQVADLPKAPRIKSVDVADALRARLLSPEGDFERDLVRPFFADAISRDDVSRLFLRFKAEFGGGRGWMTRLEKSLRVRHKRIMNFIREQDLLPPDGA